MGIYISQKGDTLYSIARKYGITLEELYNLNKNNPEFASHGNFTPWNFPKTLYVPNIYVPNTGNIVTGQERIEKVVVTVAELIRILQEYNPIAKIVFDTQGSMIDGIQISRMDISDDNDGDTVRILV